MGKRNGYLPETPVFNGTTNVRVARRQRRLRLAIFISVFCVDLLFALVILCAKSSSVQYCLSLFCLLGLPCPDEIFSQSSGVYILRIPYHLWSRYRDLLWFTWLHFLSPQMLSRQCKYGQSSQFFHKKFIFQRKFPLRIHSEGGKSCWMWNGCSSCTEDFLVFKNF